MTIESGEGERCQMFKVTIGQIEREIPGEGKEALGGEIKDGVKTLWN